LCPTTTLASTRSKRVKKRWAEKRKQKLKEQNVQQGDTYANGIAFQKLTPMLMALLFKN